MLLGFWIPAFAGMTIYYEAVKSLHGDAAWRRGTAKVFLDKEFEASLTSTLPFMDLHMGTDLKFAPTIT
jgi:hypothetical protein